MVQKLLLMHFQESNMVVHSGQLPRKNHTFSGLPGSRGSSSVTTDATTASHLSRERAPVFFVLPNEMGVGTSGDRHLAGDRPLADAADAIADSFDSVFDDDRKVRLRSLCQSMQ